MTQIPLFTTQEDKVLQDLREKTMALAEQGTICPCCQQHVKIYRRNINSGMARALIILYHHNRSKPNEWVHLPTLLSHHMVQRADEAKLLYWGLLDALEGLRDDGSSRNGYYRITAKGIEFTLGKITVPKYAYVYNQTLFGLSDGTKYPIKMISIEEALGEKFNYRTLMDAA